jgi:hypothetical protein
MGFKKSFKTIAYESVLIYSKNDSIISIIWEPNANNPYFNFVGMQHLKSEDLWNPIKEEYPNHTTERNKFIYWVFNLIPKDYYLELIFKFIRHKVEETPN